MPGYYIKQGNVGVGEATNPDATLTVKSIRAADVSLKIDKCDTTQTGNLIEAFGTGGSAVLTVSIAGVLSTSAALYLYDGTSAAPGLAFSADTDTGIYRPAANQIALVAYGSAGLVLDGDTVATQQLLAGNYGSSATPAWSFVECADAGVYLIPGSNYVGIAAVGSAVAHFKGGADVEQLQVKPSGTSATPAITWVGDPDTGLYNIAANQVAIAAYGSAVAVFDGDTAAAQYMLMINGGTSATPAIAVSAADTGIYSLTDDVLSIAAGASAIAHFKGGAAVEQIQAVASGTCATPAFSWVGDPDTGIYRPAANQVAIAVQGSAALMVKEDGSAMRLNCKAQNEVPTAGSTASFGVGTFQWSEATSALYLYTGTVWMCAGLEKIG